MPRKFDVEKINTALKRAAKVAATGTREERSGRFLAKDASNGHFASVKQNGKAKPKNGEQSSKK